MQVYEYNVLQYFCFQSKHENQNFFFSFSLMVFSMITILLSALSTLLHNMDVLEYKHEALIKMDASQ